MKLKVTVQYLNGCKDVYEADHLVTESAQWRIECGADFFLVPMLGVRFIKLERS